MSFNRPNINDIIIDSNNVTIDTTVYNASTVAPLVYVLNSDGDTIPYYATINGPNATIGYKYKLPVPFAGTYQNTVQWKKFATGAATTLPLIYSMNVKYQVFQRCVINQTVDGVVVNNNTQLTKTANTNVVFNGSSSRGTELSYVLSIKKSDNNSGWITAIEGVDYSIVASSGLSRTVKFLNSDNYQVIIRGEGYNSNTNPFDPITDSINNNRSKIMSNIDAMTLVIITNPATEDPVIVTNFTVTFPKITAVVTPSIDLGNNPETSYTHSKINVKPNVLYNTGSAKHGLLPIIISPSQWQQMLEDNTNLTLKVVNSEGSDAMPPIQSPDWLGTDIFMPLADDYKILYVITLK